jgi:UDP-N-acetylglucosamine 2-epimerase (non-hydrolysing)
LRDIFIERSPALVVVVGDVNTTLAATRTAHALAIPVAHIEAGLRSFNSKMPEEYNRVETDKISSILFVTEKSGLKNLRKEGIKQGVFLVGNIMLDTVRLFKKRVQCPQKSPFYFVTLHRAENVDDKQVFSNILDALEKIAEDAPLFLPLHHRTRMQAEYFGFSKRLHRTFIILPPLSYTEALSYEKYATLVLTDSGGIQEETSFLGTPCITLRTETERPITVEKGTNVIGGVTTESILRAYRAYKKTGFPRKKVSIPLWDGKAAERIVKELKRVL